MIAAPEVICVAVGKFVQRSRLACRVRLRAGCRPDFRPRQKIPTTLSAVGFKIAARMEALRPKVGIAPIIRTFFDVIFARQHTRRARPSNPKSQPA